MSDGLMTIDEVADYLNVSKNTIFAWRSAGKSSPPAIKVGKHLRFDRAQLLDWIAEHTEGVAA